ncbi:HAD family phosphatase [bacterium]|nr:HAD family phosphatase [bacterium]
MYKNILFDIGNVLVKLEHDRAFKKLAKYMNPLTAMLIWAKKDEFMKDIQREQDLLETGKMTIQQFFSRLKGKIGLKMDFEQFEDAWCSMFSLNEDVVQFAEELSNNYKIFLLSNTNETHIKHLYKEFPVFDFISGTALSHELGYLKPAPEFFSKALEKLNIIAEESVFIDDSDVNVNAASEAGITAFQFTSLEKLKTALPFII